MNVDGHTIKIARESQRISHVGAPAGWAGFTNVNTRSIGIEVVHANGEYPEAQYQALLPLLGRLQGHGDFNIPAHRIVGHSDADRGSRREDDPGMDFDWQRVQDLGLGVIPGFSPSDDQTMYAGFWANNPAAVLSSGANGNAVRELQQDLVDIGYVLSPAANQGVNGNFNVATERAVHAFQSHFFSRNQDHPGGLVRGRVDIQTAFRIKNVVAGVP
jgi:N-acetyl-anhydromuramyl-L-alanine amidase AmpD